MAGAGVGISDELISLQITSASVPDLTLIDLPGIARVAVKGQPEDIGDQVNSLYLLYSSYDILYKKIPLCEILIHLLNAFLLDKETDQEVCYKARNN